MRAEKPYGHTIVDGQIQYFSPSSLTLGDASSGDGCPRKWAYEKMLGRKPEGTKAQDTGTQLHAQNEEYLLTGVNRLGSLAMRGKHMLPSPGPDLYIEHDIVVPWEIEQVARRAAQRGADADRLALLRKVPLSSAVLRVAGVPVFGYVDMAHARGTNQGAEEFEDAVDPEGTVEVCDWKTTGDPRWIKTRQEMSSTIQMTIYGAWALKFFPGAAQVRLSHGYYVTKGSAASRKVSLRLLPEQVDRQMQRVNKVGRELLDVVKEPDIDRVPANTDACGAYGGCPHRVVCRAGTQNKLAKFFGPDGAARIAARAAQARNPTMVATSTRGGLLAGKKAPSPDKAALEAEMKRIAREEAVAKYPDLEAQWAYMLSVMGAPPIGGDLARVISDLLGTPLVDGGIAGQGELADEMLYDDPDVVPDLIAQIKAIVAERASGAFAAVEVDDRPPPAVLPPEAQVSPVKEEPVADQAPLAVVAEPAKPAGRRGRPPGAKNKIKTEPAGDPPPSAPFDVEPAGDPPPMDDLDRIIAERDAKSPGSKHHVDTIVESRQTTRESVIFYVDCRPSCYSQSFWPRIEQILGDMAKEAKLDHIALAPGNHELGFGKWKYALHLALQIEEIPPGHWHLETTQSEVSQIIVDAIREMVTRQGGVFVR